MEEIIAVTRIVLQSVLVPRWILAPKSFFQAVDLALKEHKFIQISVSGAGELIADMINGILINTVDYRSMFWLDTIPETLEAIAGRMVLDNRNITIDLRLAFNIIREEVCD